MSWTIRSVRQTIRSIKKPEWLSKEHVQAIRHLAITVLVARSFDRHGRQSQALGEYRRQQRAEAEFRHKIKEARDVEFIRVRESQQRQIEEVPADMRAAAHAAFQAEWWRLEIERSSQREKERQGDLGS